MTFTSEAAFEKASIDLLSGKYGWESEVINNPAYKRHFGKEVSL